tara:strand:+ start:6965 stop:9100 length:2136 start_codon:yes stop_codon:yes gene_type:complete
MSVAGTHQECPVIGRMMIGAAALLGLQPVFDGSLWWHVARGRSALSLNSLPSASLLGADVAAEADWLSGIPSALAFDLGGLHGLMALQLLIGVSIAVVLIRAVDDGHIGLKAWLMLPALLILCNRSLPVPISLTILAIPLVWNIARDQQREPVSARLVQLFVVCVLAANVAPGVLWFVATVAVAGIMRSKSPKARFSLHGFCQSLGVAVAAGCLTPRGVFAYRDAIVLAFPQTSVSRAYLVDTQFDVLAMSDDRTAIALFVVLTLLVAMQLFRQRSHVEVWACFGVLQFCAWSCSANLLPVTVLLVLLATIEEDSTELCIRKISRFLQQSQPTAFVVTASVLVAICVLGIANPDRRGGWGVAPFLDYRPLQRDLVDLDFEGTVLADDILGAGIVALLQLPGVRVQDTPERALLGGRWVSRWHLWDDIAHQRRMPYDRDDGTTGGWWLPMQDQGVSLLLVNSRHHRTLRALDTTSWRMLSLDSTVIPFGFSGEAAMARPIMQCWNDRRMVDYGPWQYEFPGESVDWARTDFLAVRGETPLSDEARRLAAVFQTLDLEHAAAKVLTAALAARKSSAIINQLCEVKWRQAIAERVRSSQASAWTRWLAIYRGKNSPFREGSQEEDFGPERPGISIPTESWTEARKFYFEGKLQKSLDVLISDDPHTMYARSQLQFEMGRPDLATDTLKSKRMITFMQHDRVLSTLVTHELQSAE